jgi:hypothetical protein
LSVCEWLEERRLLAAATLVSNTTTSGVIDVAGKVDTYEFSAAAGDRIILSVGEGAGAAAGFDPFLQLNGTTGASLQTNSGATSAYIELAAPTTGTYGVMVRELNNNTTGDYSLHFVKVPNPGPVTDPADGEGKLLSPHTTTSASIDTIGDIDLYSFTAAAGDRIVLSMGEGATAVGFDPYLALYGPTGAQIQTDSGATSAYIEVSAATAGTYNVLARELNNNTTGDYRLHFEKFPLAVTAADPADGEGTALVSNTTTSAAIGTVGDVDVYSFTAAAGDHIVLSMGEGATAAVDFDPYLALYGPNGAQAGSDASATSAFIDVTATTAGTYNVLARELNNNTTGEYRLHFEKLPFAGNATDPADGEGKSLASNTTTSAAIGTVGDLDLYTFTAAAGDHVVLSVGEGSSAAVGFDPDITLYSPTGVQLEADSGATSGFIETSLNAAGTYSVLVRELNDNTTGDYRLHFEKLPFAGSATDPADGEGKTLTSNTTTHAAIGTVGDLDLYSFTASLGERILLSVGEGAAATPGFAPDITLYDPTGKVVTTTTNAVAVGIETTATVSGTFNVLVRDLIDVSTGDYRLHFVKLPYNGSPTDPADGDGTTLVSNTTVSAAIGTPGDLDLYSFGAAAGDSFVISVGDTSGTAFAPDLTVYKPDGTVAATDTAAGGAGVQLLSVTTAGTYRVLVSDSLDNRVGNYAIHFVKAPGAQPIDPADQDGGTLVSGQTTSASLTAGDLDAYTFSLAAGGSATVRASELGATAFFPELDVFGPDGAQVGTNTGGAAAVVTLNNVTLGGVYTVVVHDSGDDNVGQYALALDATTGTDTRAPVVVANRFVYNAARQQIVIGLTEAVTGLDVTDLTLQNLTTGTTIPSAVVSATFNPLSNELVFQFPGYSAGILPDGNYHATLASGSVSDGAGLPLAGGSTLDFFVLGGDANHDRSVDFNDLVKLAQNYNTVGKSYAEGDFSYDGNVDFNDLVILAQHYNTSLPAPGAVAAPAVTASASFASDWADATAPAAPVVPAPVHTKAKKAVSKSIFNLASPIGRRAASTRPAPAPVARPSR